MVSRVEILLLFISLLFISFEHLSLPPILNDSRILSAIAAGCLILIKILSGSKRKFVLSSVSDSRLFPIYSFFLVVFISSVLHPPIGDSRGEVMLVVAGLVFFMSGYVVFKDSKRNIKKELDSTARLLNLILMGGSVISVLVFIIGKPIISLLESLFNEKIIAKLYFEYNRNRIFPLTPIDLLIPYSYSALLMPKNKYINSLLARLIFLLALVALLLFNFRSRILVSVIVMLLVIFYFRNRSIKNFIFTATIFFSIAVTLNVFVLPNNIISRFLLKDKTDYLNLMSRLHNAKLTMKMGRASLIWGVGTGNLKHYVNTETTLTRGFDDQILIYKSYQHPHNLYLKLLAENGVLGLGLYLLLIIHFINLDLRLMKNHPPGLPVLPFVASSWSFIVGSALDWYSGFTIVYFFMIRGILQGIFLQSPPAGGSHRTAPE